MQDAAATAARRMAKPPDGPVREEAIATFASRGRRPKPGACLAVGLDHQR
jgi:hypothetical protein